MQKRLPQCIHEIENIEESLRLAERKVLVCRKMVLECEMEISRLSWLMGIIADQIDRNEDSKQFSKDQARDLDREYSVLEIEVTHSINPPDQHTRSTHHLLSTPCYCQLIVLSTPFPLNPLPSQLSIVPPPRNLSGCSMDWFIRFTCP